MRHLANCITLGRVLFSAGLLFTELWTAGFYLLYTLAGLSDLLDGPVARKTGSASRNGAMLDSAADGVFCLVLLRKLLPVWTETFPWWTVPAAALVAAVRLAAYLTASLKNGRFTALHTLSNKLAGIMLFCAPYLLPWANRGAVCLAVCGVPVCSAAEELFIAVRAAGCDPDIRGFWELPSRFPK